MYPTKALAKLIKKWERSYGQLKIRGNKEYDYRQEEESFL